MKKTAFILMLITILSKILGFMREIVLSFMYGTSNISDIYIISLTIPNVIFSFFGIAISTGYIPIYNKILNESNEDVGKEFTNNLINILLVVNTIIIFLGFIFTNQIVRLFASGFEGESLITAVRFTRIGLFGIYSMGIIYIYSSYLQIKNKFIIPALVGIPLNLLVILSIIFSKKINILILPYGTLFANVIQFLFLLVFMYKNGYSYRWILHIKDKYIKNIILVSLPLIMGISVNQINVLVDRTIASQIAVGGISALNYANRLNLFIQGIFVMPIATVMFPMVSKMASENNITGLKKSLVESINIINLLVIPATVGSIVFAEPIVRFLFGRGAFDNNAIKLTSNALLYYSIGMLGYGLREILSRTFYSFQDTKTPVINSVIAMIINICLNIILSKYMGIGGLALATSIAAIFCTGLLFINLRKKIGSFKIKYILKVFFKISFCAFAMGIISKLSFNYFLMVMSSSISLCISVIIGVIVYFILIYFMKIEELDTIMILLKKKINRI